MTDFRAVLPRYGRPTITPIPVSERLPGPEDCDAEGRCWFWTHQYGDAFNDVRWDNNGQRIYGDNWGWKYLYPNEIIKTLSLDGVSTDWLPHWAISLPQPTTETL